MNAKRKYGSCLAGLVFAVIFCLLIANKTEAYASETASYRETPLVNLAKGKTKVTANEGTQLTNIAELTDGDKCGLVQNANTNKLGNGNWEGYDEPANSMKANGQWVWIQLDLEASYDIEVINLKILPREAKTAYKSVFEGMVDLF